MARIFVTQPLIPGALDRLIDDGHELIIREEPTPIRPGELDDDLADIDALICLLSDRIDVDVLDRAPRLTVVANVAVGVDNIDLDEAARRGITVCNTPGVLDASTADLAVLLMLSALRDASVAERDLRQGRWDGWSLDDHLGADLTGATVGLVGYGRIAQAVERRLGAFECTVRHHTRTDTGSPHWVPELAALAEQVDVLSLHVPGGPATVGLIDAQVFRVMGSHAVVVNTARGSVIDEPALCDALEQGMIAGAGLDVFANEPRPSARLLDAPHLTLLPHIGSATRATRRSMCELAASGVATVLSGSMPHNVVPPPLA